MIAPRLREDLSYNAIQGMSHTYRNRSLNIEGDNIESVRPLRSAHASKIRVTFIHPPYNIGSKDWVYNDRYVGVIAGDILSG